MKGIVGYAAKALRAELAQNSFDAKFPDKEIQVVKVLAPTDQLVGTYEATLILGVERSRIAKWLGENEAGKNSIEEPVARLKCGPIFTRNQIDRQARKLPGAPADEQAFEQWLRRKQKARAKRDGVSPKELQRIVDGRL